MGSKPSGSFWGGRFSTQKGSFTAENARKTQRFSKLYGKRDVPAEHPQPWRNLLLLSASHPCPNSVFLANDGERCLFTCGLFPAADRYLFDSCRAPLEVSWPVTQDVAGPGGLFSETSSISPQIKSGVLFALSAPLRKTGRDLRRSGGLERGQQVAFI